MNRSRARTFYLRRVTCDAMHEMLVLQRFPFPFKRLELFKLFKRSFLLQHYPYRCAHEAEFLAEAVLEILAVVVGDEAGVIGEKDEGGR